MTVSGPDEAASSTPSGGAGRPPSRVAFVATIEWLRSNTITNGARLAARSISAEEPTTEAGDAPASSFTAASVASWYCGSLALLRRLCCTSA